MSDNDAAFEAKVVTAEGETVGDLRKVFDRIVNPDDWKAPWAANVPHQLVGIVKRAVVFFHADEPIVVGLVPITGKVRMEGRGYMA